MTSRPKLYGRIVSLAFALSQASCGGSYGGTANPSADTNARGFASIAQAEQEIGASRVYLGFHFRRAVSQGLKQGRQVGGWVVAHVMGPV